LRVTRSGERRSSRIEVALEPKGRLLAGELDEDMERPRPVLTRMRRPSGVVVGETAIDIGCEPNVEMGWLMATLENIDGAL